MMDALLLDNSSAYCATTVCLLSYRYHIMERKW